MVMEECISSELARLRAEFVAHLPMRLDELRHLLLDPDLSCRQGKEGENLDRMLDGIVGSAAIFDLSGVAEAARSLALSFITMDDRQALPPGKVDLQALEEGLVRLDAAVRSALTTTAPTLMPPVGYFPPSQASLVYLIEDDPEQAYPLMELLQAAGYSVQRFSEPETVTRVMSNDQAPAVVILDMHFAQGNTVMMEAIETLRSGASGNTPLVLLTLDDDIRKRLAAYRAGASRCLVKPVSPDRLLRVIEQVTVREEPVSYRVLLIDDDLNRLSFHTELLQNAGMEVCTESSPLAVLDTLRQFQPEVVVLEVAMQEVGGAELASLLHEDEENASLPILFLSDRSESLHELFAYNPDWDGLLVQPVEPLQFCSAVLSRARRSREASRTRLSLNRALYEKEREHLALDHHAIVSIADVTGKIIYVNDLFCAISGYRREELLGQNHRIIKSGAHSPEFYQVMWRTISDGNVWRGDVCNRSKCGENYWVESTIVPFKDAAGKPYQYVSIRTDITHVKRLEQEANISAERLRRSQIFANIGTWDWNIQTGDLFWSERIAPLFGYLAGDLETTYENFLNAVHPQDRNLVVKAVGNCIEKGDEYNIEHRIVWPDGQVRWVQEKGDVVRDAAGNPLHMLGVVMDIHDRRMAEDSRHESEQKFRNLFELSPVGIALNDMEGNFLEANQALLDAIGYSEEEYRLLSYWQLTPDKYFANEQEQLAKLASTGRYGPYEKEYIHKDGHRVPVLLSGSLVEDPFGNKRIWSIVQDISERKRSENALEDSRRRLLEAQQLAHIGNWEADLVSGEVQWSDIIYDIFGLDKASVEPSVALFWQAIHPADLGLVEESRKQAEESGRLDVMHRIVRPDGTLRYVHELATSKYDETGRMIGLVGTVQDITELKQAEQDLILFRRIFESSEQGIGVTDATGHLLYSNKAHDIIHGYSHEEILGKHFAMFFPQESLAWAVDEIMGAINQGKGWKGLLPVLKPDGTQLMTNANVGFVAADDGSPQYLFNIMSDHTEEQHRQQQLAEAKEAAERASQAKSTFLSSMSHELRTPMNAILGFAQILEYDEALDEDQLDSVQEIIKAGHHLLELINEVLDLAKIESGRIDLSLEPVDVTEVFTECFSLIEPVAQQYGVQLIQGDIAGYIVRADRTRLKQVLLNLLSNAIKYNRENGKVILEVDAVNEDELRLTVMDTGRGVAEDRQEQLFEPFNRLDAEGSEIEGTGIGLSITRNLVEMMGGTIGIESEPGVGSRFQVILPRGTIAFNGAHDEESSALHHHDESGSGKTHTVLYIEDNPANLKLVSQILAKRKYVNLVTAHEPELGLEMAAAHRPDLILLDINMPRMDGYQILNIMSSDERLKTIPVVAITANAMPRDIERGKAAGFTDYLTKPLDVTDFLSVLDGLLEQG